MRRTSSMTVVVLLVSLMAAPAALADHIPTEVGVPAGLPADAPVTTSGPVRFIGNLPTAPGYAAPLGEAGPFERDGREYFAYGSTLYGLHIVDATDPMSPSLVSTYSAAFGCPTGTAEADGFDPLAPLGGWENDQSVTPDGRIAVLGMDAAGRCHDPAMGGLEFVDLTDVENPRALHLTRNVGEAHSVTIDPVRPWLAYTSTSDGADFIDVVDFSSCLGGVDELDACAPDVARIPFTASQWPNVPVDGDGNDAATSGCHDIRIVGDVLYCAAVGQTSIIDISKLVDDDGRLTGTLLTRGPNACEVVDATRTNAEVKVTDCSDWTEDVFAERKAKGANAPLVSLIVHDRSKPPSEDVSIAHQAEPTSDGRLLWVTDERGGGLANADGCPGGGVVFYDIRDPSTPVMAVQPDGSPAIYRTETNLPGTAHMSCTVHYGEQFGTENLFAFGWYLNGTRIVRIFPDYATTPATIEFEEVAAYVPAGAWTVQAKPLLRNPGETDEVIVYTADASRGIDVLGIEAPKISLRKASSGLGGGGGKPVRVLGKQLANTGDEDPIAISLVLVAAAAVLARRLRST